MNTEQIEKQRDPLHQDYLDAYAYESELNQLEQIFGCPVDMFGQPIGTTETRKTNPQPNPHHEHNQSIRK